MKSNKSINRRTHKNRLARSRKTKRSNAKNVLKRSTKSQKGYRGGSNASAGSGKCIELLNELIKPGITYTRTTSEELLKGVGIAVGTWLIRKSESKPGDYSLSVKINDNGDDPIAHLTIKCNLATNKIVIGELATLEVDNNSTTEYVIRFINNKVKVNAKGKEYALVSPLYDPNQDPIAQPSLVQVQVQVQQEPESPSAHNQCSENINAMLDELINHSFTTIEEVEDALDECYLGTWLIRKNEDGNFYVLSYRTHNDDKYYHIKITCANDTLILGATNNSSNTVDDDTKLITDILSKVDISNFINNSINNTIINAITNSINNMIKKKRSFETPINNMIKKKRSFETHRASQYTQRVSIHPTYPPTPNQNN